MYYEAREKSLEEITKAFCDYFNVKYQKITMPKFVKILSECWKAKIDMNFDYNPDYEDLEFYRNTAYIKCVLYAISEHYFSGEYYKRSSWYDNIQKILDAK